MDQITTATPIPIPNPGMNTFQNMAPLSQGLPDRTSGMQNFALAILFGFPALAFIIVVVRTAGRWTSRQFGWDDGLICTAMAMSVVETAASYKFIKTNYIGIRGADIPPNLDPTEGLIWRYAVQILYNPILALVKCSVLIFLYRLFGQKDGVRTYVIVLTAINLLQMVGTFFAITFQCVPIDFNWDRTIQGGRCVNQPLLYIITAGFTILTDIAVLALPAYIFRDLSIPRRTKYALLFVFLLGGLVTAASIARLIILTIGIYNLVPDPDPTYNIGFITSAIETNLALITASAPALMPLLKTWFPGLFGYDVSQTSQKVPLRDMEGRIALRDTEPRPGSEQRMTRNGISRAGTYR